MTTLRQNFIRELVVRGMAARTQAAYVRAVYGLAKYYRRSPDSLTDQELKNYLYYLAREKKLSSNSINQAVCGLRFFYKSVLQRSVDFLCEALPFRRRTIRRPQVFSSKEIEQLLRVGCRHLKPRAFLMTVYGGGLRLEEACHLKAEHINRARMQIRVEQGKGRKDRYTLLSPCCSKCWNSIGSSTARSTGCFRRQPTRRFRWIPGPAKRCSTVRWPVPVYLTEEGSIVCATVLQPTKLTALSR